MIPAVNLWDDEHDVMLVREFTHIRNRLRFNEYIRNHCTLSHSWIQRTFSLIQRMSPILSVRVEKILELSQVQTARLERQGAHKVTV